MLILTTLDRHPSPAENTRPRDAQVFRGDPTAQDVKARVKWINCGRAWKTLTTVSQEVQGAGVAYQEAQALDPATAHAGHAPGCPAEGTRLPKKPQQQLPLLRSKESIREAEGEALLCIRTWEVRLSGTHL